MGDFGSAFGPLRAPEPTKEEQLLAQLRMLGSEIERLNVGLVEASEDPDTRAQILQAPPIDAKALAAEIAGAVSGAVTLAMQRFADYGRGEVDAALVEALREQTQKIMGLGRKMSALSTIPSGGSSGHVIVDSGNVSLTGGPHDVRDLNGIGHRNDASGDPTLVGLTKALQALTTDLRTEARRRPTYRLASSAASIVSGAFATIHTVTPTVATTVTGFNADLNGAATLNYRLRLITGTDAAPTVATQEQVSTSDNSWTPASLSVPANTRIAVQVLHGEVTAQEFIAALAYYEEP